MIINFKSILLMVLIMLVSKIDAQTNSGASQKSWEWKGHNNWFLPTGNAGYILNQTTGVVTGVQDPSAESGSGISGYQGVTCASDDNGKLLFFSNGIKAWRADGTLITDQLWAGSECGYQDGGTSATHGVLTVRHPLTPHKYYIITIDDVVNQGVVNRTGGHHENNCSPRAGNPGVESHGISYALIDSSANLVHSSQAIETNITTNLQGQLRTTEDMAATMHANGVDIWITFHPLWATHVVSYLLTVDGFVTEPVVSGEGIVNYIDISEGFGGLDFTQDGSKLAVGAEALTADYRAYGTISLYDFDNATGEISNRKKVYNNQWSSGNVYNLRFGPNGKWLHFNGSAKGKVDISSNDELTIRASQSASAELSSSNSFNGAAITASGVLKTSDKVYAAAGLTSRFSSNNMFIPPSGILKIKKPSWFCDTTTHIDFDASWVVLGIDGESVTHEWRSSKGAFKNTNTGEYDPRIAGYGLDTITFKATKSYTFYDTLIVKVNSCNPKVTNTIKLSSCGTISGFAKTGVYVDTIIGATVDTIEIHDVTIFPKPNAIIYDATICRGDSNVFDAGNGFDSYIWSNMGAGSFESSVVGESAGTYTVEVTNQYGCKDTSSAVLTINPLPSSVASASASTFTQGTFVQLFSNASGNSYTWSPTGETSENIITSVGGLHTVTFTNPSTGCFASSSITVKEVSVTNCIDTTHIIVLDTNYINITDTNYVSVNNYVDVFDTNYISVNNYIDVYDSLIVDLTGAITSLDAPFNNTLQVKVYPNPASEVLILEVLDAGVTASYTYELMNINGQTVVANGSLSSNTNTIDISSYSGGTYYVKFYDAQQKMVNQAPVVIRK